jgi:hypothetical protein
MKLKGYKNLDLLKIAQDLSGQPPSDETPQDPAQPDVEQPTPQEPLLTDQEKWDMFDKYVKLLEESGISKQQLEDSKNVLEQLIWGTINKPA